MDRNEEANFYRDPSNLEPQGPGRRRTTALTEVVPVRLRRDVLERIRVQADLANEPLSSWIRRTLEAALDAVESHTDDPSDPSRTVLAVLFPDTTVRIAPADATRAQVLISSEEVVLGLQRAFARLASDVRTVGISRTFEELVVVDQDSYHRRPRQMPIDFARKVRSDVEAMQHALALVQSLSAAASLLDEPKALDDLRQRVVAVRNLIDEVEHEVLHTPKTGTTKIVDSALIAFYRYADVARAALGEIETQLYELHHASAPPQRAPGPASSSGLG